MYFWCYLMRLGAFFIFVFALLWTWLRFFDAPQICAKQGIESKYFFAEKMNESLIVKSAFYLKHFLAIALVFACDERFVETVCGPPQLAFHQKKQTCKTDRLDTLSTVCGVISCKKVDQLIPDMIVLTTIAWSKSLVDFFSMNLIESKSRNRTWNVSYLSVIMIAAHLWNDMVNPNDPSCFVALTCRT